MEDRRLLALDPGIAFLQESVDLSNRSPNPTAFGQPAVYLYADDGSGGTYGDIQASAMVLDGKDPNAGYGVTSLRASWNGAGVNGWFQFWTGDGQLNRPRDIADFGLARAVRFPAKGDTAGQDIQVRVFKVLSGGGWQLVRNLPIDLSTAWQDFAIDLADLNLTPHDLHAVQFVIRDGANDGGRTFWLDAQTWSLLTLARFRQYAEQLDWRRVAAWVEEHLQVCDDTRDPAVAPPLCGVTYSDQSTPGVVWLEGTAQAAVVAWLWREQAGYEYLVGELETARAAHRNGDGRGIVAASRDSLQDPLLGAIYDARLHVGATAWTYFATAGINPLLPQFEIPDQAGGMTFVVDDWNNKVTETDLGHNYFAGNSGAVESAPGSIETGLSGESSGEPGGSLAVTFDFAGTPEDSFAGVFTSLFGLTDTLVSLDGSGSEPAATTAFPDYYLDMTDVYRGFAGLAGRSIEGLQAKIKLNFPVISSAVLNAETLTVSYSVPSATANSEFPLAVEFFLADAGNQEGQTYLGTHSYPSPGAATASQAQCCIPLGVRVVATATDANGNTSEFSPSIVVTAALSAPVAAASEFSPAATLDAATLAPLVWQAIAGGESAGLDPAPGGGVGVGLVRDRRFARPVPGLGESGSDRGGYRRRRLWLVRR